MKISRLILSIPPYISTSWDKIELLSLEESLLSIYMKNGVVIRIPDLQSDVIEQIFIAHANFLEMETTKEQPTFEKKFVKGFEQILEVPLRITMHALEQLNQALQHNPANADLPLLTNDIISKVKSLAKIMPVEDILSMPPAHEGCNCLYCQIARTLKESSQERLPENHPLVEEHEKITEKDLQFEQWKITQIEDKLYSVTNKLDPNEQYTVFLGDPVGCTCGKKHCEHIVAVLRH